MIAFYVDPQDNSKIVVTSDDPDADGGAWARLREGLFRGTEGGGKQQIIVRLDVFLSELATLREIRSIYGTELDIEEALRDRIAACGRDRRAREAAAAQQHVDLDALEAELQESGFTRDLKPFQKNNLARITALPHAADFSVPGAGKTAVALANFALQRKRGGVEQALVVAPIAAFTAWEEETVESFLDPPQLSVHRPGQSIPRATEILVTNYHRLASDYDTIRRWVSRSSTHAILDEAHRVKRGRGGVHGRAALDLALVAARRDILTGTPTPQGASDIVALISYLYPGQAHQILPAEAFNPRTGLDEQVLQATNAAVARYFVRTRKTELGLPGTEMKVETMPMGPVQSAIYLSLLGTYRGQLLLPPRDRHEMRRLGQIVMYLLEAATNPLLLPAGSDPDDLRAFAHPQIELRGDEHIKELLRNFGSYERPWKYDYVQQAVADAANSGNKVIVWTNFVRNIRLLEIDLQAYSPAVVHGGIHSRDSAPNNASRVREDELDRFRHDDGCTVLLANPAAAGEGISLHHWCHHAIYLDRTFNAGHFLQSQDRIHRLGLPNDVITHFTLLVSEGTIDEAVDARLHTKIRALATLMDDPGLVRLSLPDADPVDLDEINDEENIPALDDDVTAIMEHIGGGAG